MNIKTEEILNRRPRPPLANLPVKDMARNLTWQWQMAFKNARQFFFLRQTLDGSVCLSQCQLLRL